MQVYFQFLEISVTVIHLRFQQWRPCVRFLAVLLFYVRPSRLWINKQCYSTATSKRQRCWQTWWLRLESNSLLRGCHQCDLNITNHCILRTNNNYLGWIAGSYLLICLVSGVSRSSVVERYRKHSEWNIFEIWLSKLGFRSYASKLTFNIWATSSGRTQVTSSVTVFQ